MLHEFLQLDADYQVLIGGCLLVILVFAVNAVRVFVREFARGRRS